METLLRSRKYVLHRTLGTGSYGTAYLCSRENSDYVVVKKVRSCVLLCLHSCGQAVNPVHVREKYSTYGYIRATTPRSSRIRYVGA
jgi:hypothetical protein